MDRIAVLIALAGISLGTTGCYATKLLTVPMRVVGAVASAVPLVGDTAHSAIDTAAEAVDDVAD